MKTTKKVLPAEGKFVEIVSTDAEGTTIRERMTLRDASEHAWQVLRVVNSLDPEQHHITGGI